ncbi:MAG: PIN domain-containing protein [Pyrinomonadaceae bacterium]
MSLKFLLDTNVCINYLNYPGSKVSRIIGSTPLIKIAVCSVVKAELFYGSRKSKDPAKTLSTQLTFLENFESLAFDDRSASTYASIRADLAAKGTIIGPYDLQIAAIALANDATHNTREFSRVSGLRLEDWEI